jgi:hypothetical protein
MKILTTLFLMMMLGVLQANAAETQSASYPVDNPKRDPAAAAAAPEKAHNKDLNFDDEVLEGMGKNPMDSVENLSKRDAVDNGHLYHKKANFKTEMHDSSQEAGYLPQ